jgi:hypothetical protein
VTVRQNSDREAEGFKSSAVTLLLKDSPLLEPKVIETEKVLNGLIRALRDHL